MIHGEREGQRGLVKSTVSKLMVNGLGGGPVEHDAVSGFHAHDTSCRFDHLSTKRKLTLSSTITTNPNKYFFT